MKKILLLLLITLSSLNIQAQNLEPLLKTYNSWSYYYTQVSPWQQKHYFYNIYEVLNKDTIISNVLYKTVSQYSRDSCPIGYSYNGSCAQPSHSQTFLYLRQGVNSIYQAPDSISKKEKLWYRFSGTNIKDTVYATPFYGNTVIYKIDTVNFQGVKKRRFYTNYTSQSSCFYIDGVGFTGGGIDPTGNQAWEYGRIYLTCIVKNGISYQINYTQSGASLNSVSSCMERKVILSLSSEISENIKSQLSYLDNGDIKFVLNNSEEMQIAVYNLNGNKVYSSKSHSKFIIEKQGFQNGLFILEVIQNNKFKYKNKIVF